MPRHRDPEAVAHYRESANWGAFEVVIEHEEHGVLGTLDETFSNDYDAAVAANEATISDVGIETEIREVDSDNV